MDSITLTPTLLRDTAARIERAMKRFIEAADDLDRKAPLEPKMPRTDKMVDWVDGLIDFSTEVLATVEKAYLEPLGPTVRDKRQQRENKGKKK